MKESDINQLLQIECRSSPEPTPSCPDEGQLAGFVARGLNLRDMKATEEHMATCEYCVEQVAFLIRSSEWPNATDVPAHLLHSARGLVAPEQQRIFRWNWRWATAAAAASFALLFVVIALQSRRQNPFPSDTMVAQHTSPAPAVSPLFASPPLPAKPESSSSVQPPKVNPTPTPMVRSNTAELLPTIITPRDGAVLRRAELEFRWQAVADAIFYDVQIMSSAGDLVFEGRTEETRLKPGSAAVLVPGSKYFVVTRAHLRQGKEAKSNVVSFRLAE